MTSQSSIPWPADGCPTPFRNAYRSVIRQALDVLQTGLTSKLVKQNPVVGEELCSSWRAA